jgi:hypothetical protein
LSEIKKHLKMEFGKSKATKSDFPKPIFMEKIPLEV